MRNKYIHKKYKTGMKKEYNFKPGFKVRGLQIENTVWLALQSAFHEVSIVEPEIHKKDFYTRCLEDGMKLQLEKIKR